MWVQGVGITVDKHGKKQKPENQEPKTTNNNNILASVFCLWNSLNPEYAFSHGQEFLSLDPNHNENEHNNWYCYEWNSSPGLIFVGGTVMWTLF